MYRDRYRLRKKLQAITSNLPISHSKLLELSERIGQSHQLAESRKQNIPAPQLDADLPIFDRRNEIVEAVSSNQVVVISGETGSGKSTQLPLIFLQMGLGVYGYIGHTQPRRIAARSVANRIASQVSTTLGDKVGFKIRFDDKTKDSTYVKLMTDGILLAETQSDRFLDQYELIIIDEAHERSLNIDFLIGNLKQILRKRKDLKVVITSATIDTERFAQHFASSDGKPAPVVNVKGRTYPVEIQYRPLDEFDDNDPLDHLVNTVTSLISEEHGDILVFLPTEKDIKSASKKLRGALPGSPLDILPLYARLTSEQQNAIFTPGTRRRIVLATNVAESSITVPRIRMVVDSGTARISRYAPRSKVQRLPIEAVSQASANQRAGRCGRIGPGICVRLFSQDDYESRSEFTTPEIRRTNLASVILQTLALKLGEISAFPFIDPPGPDAVRDGYKTLFEIGAIDDRRQLTQLGRWLAKLPVDPRIGRMLYAANEEGCLNEILIIASALEIQDPRIRPAERQKQADEQHQKFKHDKSDFMSFLLLWDFFHKLRGDLSRSKYKLACQQNFLSLSQIHQWQEVHRQLKGMVRQLGLKVSERKDDYNAIHRSLLTGLLSGVAMLSDKFEYTGAGGIKFHLWPGSGIFESKPKWVVVSELVETAKRYGRTVAKIAPEWIEPIAEHLLKHSYSDPHWSKKQQTVMAYESISLFGLPIVNRRRRHFAKLEPVISRQLFIENGIVEDQITTRFGFLEHNRAVLDEIEKTAAKTRSRDWIVDTGTLCQFYEDNLPERAVDVSSLQKLIRKDDSLDHSLRFTKSDLGFHELEMSNEMFPDSVNIGGVDLPIDYRFEPGHESDGATLTVPQEALSQISDIQSGWLVPGLNEARIVAMIKSLPKSIRRHFVPVPQTAKLVFQSIKISDGSIEAAVAKTLSQLSGELVTPDSFDPTKIDQNLKLNFRVIDETGENVAVGREVGHLRKSVGVAADNFVQVDNSEWHDDGLNDWTWNELPKQVLIQRGVNQVTLYPAIVDQSDCVGLRLVDSESVAKYESRLGITRLFAIRNKKSLKKQVNWLPELDRHSVLLSRLLNTNELKDGLRDAIARLASVDKVKKLPSNKLEFDDIANNSIESISVATQKIAGWLPKFANSFHGANLSVEKLGNQFTSLKDDVAEQISALTQQQFLLTTPWNWLQHFPRFFEAIAVRCEKYQSGGQKNDVEMSKRILSYWTKLVELREQRYSLNCSEFEIERFRWMVEEFRVSLFAQKLGTSMTVSPKRLDKQLEKIQNS